jgi:hypothetical protein
MLEKPSLACSKALVVIGFARRTAMRPEFLLGTCDVVYGSDARHATALAALVGAAAAESRVGIARYVPRENGRVMMVALWPHEEQGVPVFLMSPLPFKDDMREFCFRPLSDRGISQQQADAAAQLLSAFRAPASDGDDGSGASSGRLRACDVFNPNLNRFYETCCLKIDSDDVQLQPPHASHARLFDVQQSQAALERSRSFAAAFALHESTAGAAKKQKRTVALSSISLAELAGELFNTRARLPLSSSSSSVIFFCRSLDNACAGKDLAVLGTGGADGNMIAGASQSHTPLALSCA